MLVNNLELCCKAEDKQPWLPQNFTLLSYKPCRSLYICALGQINRMFTTVCFWTVGNWVNPNFFFFFFLIFWLCWVFVGACLLFCSCSERRLLFIAVHGLLIAVASLCCGAQALGTQASVVVARGFYSAGSVLRHMGLLAPWNVGSSWTRAGAHVPCIGRWILNHCATREVPQPKCF